MEPLNADTPINRVTPAATDTDEGEIEIRIPPVREPSLPPTARRPPLRQSARARATPTCAAPRVTHPTDRHCRVRGRVAT